MLQKIFTIIRGETTTEANTLQNTTSEVPVLSRKSKCLEHDQQEETKKEEIGRAPKIEQSKEKTQEIKKAEEQLMECTKWFEHNLALHQPDLLVNYPSLLDLIDSSISCPLDLVLPPPSLGDILKGGDNILCILTKFLNNLTTSAPDNELIYVKK